MARFSFSGAISNLIIGLKDNLCKCAQHYLKYTDVGCCVGQRCQAATDLTEKCKTAK